MGAGLDGREEGQGEDRVCCRDGLEEWGISVDAGGGVGGREECP